MVSAAKYRAYLLDKSGLFLDVEWINANTDEEAVATVQARSSAALCEIWNERRLVAKLDVNRPSI